MSLEQQHNFNILVDETADYELWRCSRCNLEYSPFVFMLPLLARYIPFCSYWRCRSWQCMVVYDGAYYMLRDIDTGLYLGEERPTLNSTPYRWLKPRFIRHWAHINRIRIVGWAVDSAAERRVY